eukprot:scaffold15447_cov123-Isochrysis_galbana.AAC.3
MAPPSYTSALTSDFLGVPPSPKRPREDEQPEVRQTAQSRAWPWPDSNVTITIDIYALLSIVVSVRLHRGTGESACFTSPQTHITDCSAELCRTALSHHDSERARATKDMAVAVAMTRVI